MAAAREEIKTGVPLTDKDPHVFRILLSPKPSHIQFAVRVKDNHDYKQFQKMKQDLEQEKGVRMWEVVIRSDGEMKLIRPDGSEG